jgi:hypothetical protein
MKTFDTKINRFSGQNLPQQPLSLSMLESDDSLSLSSKYKRIEKIEK